MNARQRFVEYCHAVDQLDAVPGVEPITIPTYAAMANWLNYGPEAGISSSSIIDRAIWYAGLRRMAGRLSLQCVLLDGKDTAHELPLFTYAPDIVHPRFSCEVSGRSSAMLQWALDSDNTKYDSVNEVIHDGVAILRTASELDGPVRFATSVHYGRPQFKQHGKNKLIIMKSLEKIRAMPPLGSV